LTEVSDAAAACSVSRQSPSSPLPSLSLLPSYWALRGHSALGAPGLTSFADGRARKVTDRLAAAAVQLGTAGSLRAAAAATKWLQGGLKLATASYGAVMAAPPGYGSGGGDGAAVTAAEAEELRRRVLEMPGGEVGGGVGASA
ncbi:hypothetical protein Agub_g9507, partial [Astrephomene gubernaculifera]